jgi:hypothetical protein
MNNIHTLCRALTTLPYPPSGESNTLGGKEFYDSSIMGQVEPHLLPVVLDHNLVIGACCLL